MRLHLKLIANCCEQCLFTNHGNHNQWLATFELEWIEFKEFTIKSDWKIKRDHICAREVLVYLVRKGSLKKNLTFFNQIKKRYFQLKTVWLEVLSELCNAQCASCLRECESSKNMTLMMMGMSSKSPISIVCLQVACKLDASKSLIPFDFDCLD